MSSQTIHSVNRVTIRTATNGSCVRRNVGSSGPPRWSITMAKNETAILRRISILPSFPSVIYFPQNQPVRRRTHPGRATVACIKHHLHILCTKLSFADLHNRSDDPTAHFVEKAV